MEYTNSSLVSYVHLSPNRSPRTAPITKITPHHMAGNGTLVGVGNTFSSPERKASSNYAIDSQGKIAMYVEEKNRAWTSNSSINDNQAITIEVANSESGGDWPVSEAAYESLINLCVDICQRNNISELIFTGDPIGTLTHHKMFAPTACPGPYLERRTPELVQEVNRRLQEEEMTQEQFNTMMNTWLTEKAQLPGSNWGAELDAARAWNEQVGLLKGDEYGNKQFQSYATREQIMLMLYRMLGK